MFRNQYDSDVTVWSPQGRLHQVEYAMEAVKLGTATVGLKNKDYAVLVALCKPTSELSDTQRKIIPIDDHLGISIAGLTADARVLSRYLRSECLNYKHSYDTTYPVSRLITNLGNKMQTTTQRYDRRPYGVGLLVAGYDERGPHIYQVTPSATFFNCKANSIGSRSQSARTYLEKNLNKFLDSSKDEIIRHGIRAILGTLPTDEQGKDAGQYDITVAIVGKDQPFTILSNKDSAKHVAIAKENDNDTPRNDDDDDRPSPPEEPAAGPRDPEVLVATEQRP
uniref:Proteasome subunit alpha type-1 n=2 Tax=Drosophila melanogaster TaxID=7227 RepID=PSA1_DROME|nr:proteasome alpha6 subunit, isoform B [Drosophila melanogaster]NP_523532.1 proteasome alpha6 subunit, isoform A [Drosophila melanogaster]P12881.1 RecName: Full=Proteasome subunit alpha type-1; AltName: Full=PROS-Dm35; AltName: Full=Proteasome 35 kDa subunit [Drosophila melanogaster]AOQ13914.1 Prosalpha6-PA [synthetic construct]AAF52875.1 proteasome alpha6 subunit, isoform A [Drosophila melanogaster]AFH89821.1 FI20108p1 [Drosophila melanogaster]AHN54312.1 proteasome alpha6 subunit, isoform B|eukprot:NP_001285798.1 proteasome alpha6 subunit, isoform B [Drosophila melanogaster]